MILKGNQRGGGQQLAAHLLNSFDNERVEIVDVRGAVAPDLPGAFAEWTAVARAATHLKKEFYSLSLSPDPGQGRLTPEQYLDLIGRVERSLKLVKQPRAVVVHEKRGDDGVLREHCHAVWSRADTEKMKGVEISHDRLKLRTVTREFCRDHGLELPANMKPGRAKDTRVDRFNSKAAREDLGERQQKERTGVPKKQHMANLAACWHQSGNGSAFVQLMAKKGYTLARGDQRGYVVVDSHGEIHSLSKYLKGVAKSRELKDRLAGHPIDKLPAVADVQAFVKQQRKAAEKQASQETIDPQLDEKLRALQSHQQQRRAGLDRRRVDLIARHISEREGLKQLQEARVSGIVGARLARQPKGLLAFVVRITGLKALTQARHARQDRLRDARQRRETKSLDRRHARELHDLDRSARALDRLEGRENRGALNALRRDEIQREAARAIKPEFDRAASGEHQRTGTDDTRAPAPKSDFDNPARPPLDLVEEFNREVENRRAREERDRDHDGPDRTFDPKDRKN